MIFETETRKPRAAAEILLIPNEKIRPNPNQPRRQFDQSELVNLAISIRMNGILQPLTVRETPTGYELISGERRLRASRLAGLAVVPCIIIDVNDMKSAVYSLIENLQRQDLGFFEEAAAISRLLDTYSVSRDEAARMLGKSPSTISNKLRLLTLPDDIQQKITDASLTERHARALLRLEKDDIPEILDIVIKRGLTVAQTEKLIENTLIEKTKHRRQTVKMFSDVRIFVNTVKRAVETMQSAGIPATCKQHDTENEFRYEIVIPKRAAQPRKN